MKVFVTGGTGFLGLETIRALVASDASVRAMVRDKRARLPAGAEPVECRFDDSAGLPLVTALTGCDAVLHLAGKVSRDPLDASEMHALHVEGTQKLLAAMRAAQVKRLALASTSGTIACSKKPGRIATESDEAGLDVIGRWPYYVSKRLQEQVVLRAHFAREVDAVIVNPSLLLGPGDERMSSIGDVHKILSGRYPAITDGTVAFVDVRDAAAGLVSALTKGRGGEKYLLNGANMSARVFVERVARAGDVSMPKVQLEERWGVLGAKLLDGLYHAMDRTPPTDVVSVEMAYHHWGCSSSKAEAELGFRARDPQDTVADTVTDLERRGLFRRRRRTHS